MMRLLVITIAVLLVCSTPAFCITDVSFDRFIKSREVVDTFYFNSNAETLTKTERQRLNAIVTKLRELQQNGRMIRVEGFSSPEGDQEENFKLSFYRAKTVADLIQDKGLPAEVTLTGFGDLRAGQDDFSKERRVEIASYVKPGGMRRIQIADEDKNSSPEMARSKQEIKERLRLIDSYRVEQAIKSKVEDSNKGLAEDGLQDMRIPDLSQFDTDFEADLERGYTLWRKSVDPEYALRIAKVADQSNEISQGLSKVKPISVPGGLQRTFSKVKPVVLPGGLQRGYSQAKPAETEELQRGYSQTKPAETEELQRGYSQTKPAIPADAPELSMLEPPLIDALMIEQAIMEKIGISAVEPSGEVTQVSVKYQPDEPSH